MSSLHALEKFQPKTIGLIGDVILDTYTFGSTKRVSPEAPVPVLSVQKEEKKAGGAGNVALNLLALGMNVKLMARVGDDAAGREVRRLLSEAHVDCTYLLSDPSSITSVKNRFIASSQQLLRVDNERTEKVSDTLEARFLNSLDEWLQGVDIVAISDYAKGLLTDRLLEELIGRARAHKKSVLIDPKGNDFRKYSGATLIKPNYQEALMAVPQSERTLERAIEWIQREVGVSHVMVTRSEEGISLYSVKEGLRHYPVRSKKEVRDGTGAGDTVLACLTAALASNLTLDEAVPLANTFASIGIERLGCAVISLHELASRLLDQNPTGKTISWKAFAKAHSALSMKELCFFSISSHDLHVDALKRIRKQTRSLSGSQIAIVLIQEEKPDEHVLELIAAFDSIHWVVWGAKQEEAHALFPSACFVS